MADGLVVGVESDEFRVMMDGERGDDEVQGTGGEALIPAGLSETGGVAPKPGGSGQQRQGGELGFNQGAFLGGGVPEDLKGDWFAEAGVGVQNPTLYYSFLGGRCAGSGEIDPKRGFNQSRHWVASV